MKKVHCLWMNFLLLGWFLLDMIGVSFGHSYLVARSWSEDGVFMLVFVVVLITFAVKERIGKLLLIGWQALWLITQFISHEWYTIAGGGEGKIRYFADSIKLIYSESRYIPDLYHIVLHLLIAASLVLTSLYIIRTKDMHTQ